MWYLFVQIWLLLLIAFVLGWAAHWFFCCRSKQEETLDLKVQGGANVNEVKAEIETTAKPAVQAAAPAADANIVDIKDEWKPQGFAAPPSDADDLKRIKGVGSVIEKTLNELGVYQFSQIAQWNQDNVTWVDNFIAFPGRINREKWVEQAKTLSVGGTTEFANRVDKGDIDY